MTEQEPLAPWEAELLATNQEQVPPADETPIYTELYRQRREEFWARVGAVPLKEGEPVPGVLEGEELFPPEQEWQEEEDEEEEEEESY